MAVKLSVMVEGLKWVCGHDTVYVNIDDNTLINVADPVVSDLPQEHILDELEEKKGTYIELPSYRQIDTKKIAKEFAASFDDGAVKSRLEKALNGPFWYRKFLKQIEIFEYKVIWYNFRTKSLKQIAINFLNLKRIEYEDDISY